jgi:hypothetical protein
MSAATAETRWHPSLESLALYANGDLGLFSTWRIRYHANRCAACEQQVLLFRSAAAELKHEANAQTLTPYEAIADWTRLEREMLGNIAVGVAAARCVDNVGRKPAYLIKGLVAAALVLLFVAGWMTHIPAEQTQHLANSLQRLTGLGSAEAVGTIVRTTPRGIAVRTQGATLTILHPASAIVSLSGSSAVAARYVDDDTGQVTITNVYGQ